MSKENRGKLDDTLAAMFSNRKYSNSYLFYAHMISQCSIKMDESLPACAGVSFEHDHYNLYINKEMFDEENLEGRLAILKHEMLHILDGHLTYRMVEDKKTFKVWNYATDCAMNQHIDKDHLPKWVITPQSLNKLYGLNLEENRSSEEYYNALLNTNLEKQKGSGQDGDGENQNGEGKTIPRQMDDHETWKRSQGDKDLQADLTKKMIEQAQEETIKNAGTVPSSISKWLELHSKKSEISWQKVVRNIAGNKKTSSRTTIMRRDRRAPHRNDLRGKLKNRTFNVLVVADVSGSMSDDAILSTFAEVRHICDVTNSAADLVQVDAVAYEPEKLSKNTKLVDRKGSGGTTLHPALEKAKQNNIDYQLIIILTDGYLFGDDIDHFYKENKHLIWLIEPKGKIDPEMIGYKSRAFKLKGEK